MSAPVRLVRGNAKDHPTPMWFVLVGAVRIGLVTRWTKREPKTGRWAHRGLVERVYWRADRGRGDGTADFRTRGAAIDSLLAARSTPDLPTTERQS